MVAARAMAGPGHGRRRARAGRSVLRVVTAVAALGVIVLGAVGWYELDRAAEVLAERFSGRPWVLPAQVFADDFPLHAGIDLARTGFVERVRRLGYRVVEGPIAARGDVHLPEALSRVVPAGRTGRAPATVDVALHAFADPDRAEPGRTLRIDLAGTTVTRVVDVATGADVYDAALEPEPLAGFYDGAWEARRVVRREDVPPLLVAAVLAIEDRRFYEHGAVDWRGIARAGWRNVLAGRVVEGGSTLTQQLMKNFFLTEQRTWGRKARELAMAIVAEQRYGKDEILALYLNEIYLGQSGAKGVFGVREAGQFYFGKDLGDLTLGEVALLAGLIRAPNAYSPFRNPARATERRDAVLAAMERDGAITAAEASAARAEAIELRAFVPDRNNAPYFVDHVRRELAATYPPEVLTGEGLRVFTSLDVEMQIAAESALREGLEDLERRHPRLVPAADDPDAGRIEGALVALHPATGEIRAMVGGRDYRTSQFNRATDAARQPGSIFKPVVYWAALDPGGGEPHVTATTMVVDEPFSWAYDGRVWTPANHGRRYHGTVTVRRALEESMNAATARLAFDVGLPRVVAAAEALGFPAPVPALPAIVLGGVETTPLTVAEVYAVFASQGQRTASRSVKQVVDAGDGLLEGRPLSITATLSPEVAYLVTHLLAGAVDHGTGAGVRAGGFADPAAGKTGTTNDYGDAWFAGFTPDLVTVVWVGYDRRRSLGLTGAQAALPIWTAFMRRVTAGRPVRDFEVPSGVRVVDVDPASGQLATPGCPTRLAEAFLEADVPAGDCPLHGGARPLPVASPAMRPDRPTGDDRPWWQRWFQ